MDNSWENKNKNLIDKYNIRDIYLSKQADYIVTLCGCFREATHEGFGLCSVLNVDMINLQPTFMMFTNGLI